MPEPRSSKIRRQPEVGIDRDAAGALAGRVDDQHGPPDSLASELPLPGPPLEGSIDQDTAVELRPASREVLLTQYPEPW